MLGRIRNALRICPAVGWYYADMLKTGRRGYGCKGVAYTMTGERREWERVDGAVCVFFRFFLRLTSTAGVGVI